MCQHFVACCTCTIQTSVHVESRRTQQPQPKEKASTSEATSSEEHFNMRSLPECSSRDSAEGAVLYTLNLSHSHN